MNESTLNDLRAQWLALQARHEAARAAGAGEPTGDAQAPASALEAMAAERAALERRIVAAVVEGAGAASAGTAQVSAASTVPAQPTSPAPVPADMPASRPKGPFWALAGIFVLVVAGVGYGWKGTPQAVGTPPPGFEQGAAGGALQHSGGAQLEALVKQLQERLAKAPGDHEGWSLLGRSQMALGRFAEAAAAYEKAIALKPDDPATLTDRADALGVLNGRSLEGEPARLLEKALKVDPRHVKALVLVGTMEFQRGDYAAAQRRWQEAVDVGPAGDGLVELAREGVAQAQARQGRASAPQAQAQPPQGQPQARAQAPAQPPAGAVPQAAAGPGISGTVRLSPALKAQAGPNDTVFIFARAAGGGMPLAIVQKRVADLPAEFKLDDSQAMSDASRLSSASQVVVTARVSKSGQATPQPGDLEGASSPVAPGAKGLVVEISNVRK